MRRLCLEDLFFLLLVGCKRTDMNRDWIYERVREVESAPDGYLDLWFRAGYKSSIITFGLTIQDILKDPEVTIGIFSHTRPISKAFGNQVKREFEGNQFLKDLFPDILYQEPHKESPKWSLDDGIIVKRKTNPKEATLESWGLVDSQPTSKHFKCMVYDDVVVRESVTTPEMILKTNEAFSISLNLGAENCRRRFIGTRYHSRDTYYYIIENKTAKPRIYPATDDGTFTGKPVLMSQKEFDDKVKDQGSYVSSCFIGDTKILMGDWSEKSIKDIKSGESVVGYSFPNGKGNKTRLVKSTVLAIASKESIVFKFTFQSGRQVICTRDHKFFTGRRGKDVGGTDGHSAYVKLGMEKFNLKSAISIYNPNKINGNHDKLAAAWLSGIFDGEGSCCNNVICIHQSHEHNPEVCGRIEDTLKILGFDYRISDREPRIVGKVKHKSGRIYTIRGGRQEKLRFLNICRPARGFKIINSLYEYGTRDIGLSSRDKLINIEELGNTTVYNIQTETGNYVADGYAVKNCQLLQNPLMDTAMGFKNEWLSYYNNLRKAEKWNYYILVDAASDKKKTSDYTAIWVIGLGVDHNYYIVDGIRDRINLTERTEVLFCLVRKWQPILVGYEKYGMMSDIEHIKYVQEQEGYRFAIVELGGSMPKNDRIRRLVPLFEQKRIYIPNRLLFINNEGKAIDLINEFLKDEYGSFPVSAHDDMLDCLSRIVDEDLGVKFPKKENVFPLGMPNKQNEIPDPFNLNNIKSNDIVYKTDRLMTLRESLLRG